MQNMLGSHSLTEAMQQRIADYSLEIRSAPQIMSHPKIISTRLMFRLCDLLPPNNAGTPGSCETVSRKKTGLF